MRKLRSVFTRLCILLFALGCVDVSRAGVVDVTSDNIKAFLESKSLKVSAAKLEVSAASEREGSFGRSFLPAVELYGGLENFKSGTRPGKTQPIYGAEIKSNLFNGGRDKIESEVRGLETDKRKFQSLYLISDELEKARSSYWQIRYLQEKITLLKLAVGVNRQSLDAAKRRIKNGVATDSDRFEFEMKDAELRFEIAESEILLATQTKLFSILLGFDESTTLAFPERLEHDHDYQTKLGHSPKDHQFLFKEKEIQSEQSLLSAKRSSRSWWPKVDAYVSYNQFTERDKDFSNDADRAESVVGIRVSMSLASGIEANREGAALTKEAQAARSIADYQKQEVEIHMYSELAELKLLHSQVHEAEENISIAERYYKITQSEYARGVKNSPDVLGAAEKLYDMRHKRLEIVRNFQLSKAHVLAKLGR